MPWRRYYYRRWNRRRRPRYGRFRKTFRGRRYRRRRWVSKKLFSKRKLKRLTIKEYQPHSIRKCKVKGLLSLFQTGIDRIANNFDMYEESIVPERLPGGGGFSLKNISLQSLYIEHIHGHNIFTSTNEPYPLVRYTGCTLKLYRSENIDYIISYNNQWPLRSNLKMYNSMQPQIHYLQKNRIIVRSKRTTPLNRKPYKKVFIPPPTQLRNQWYFQSQIANTPLFMLLTSSTTLDHWYIGTRNLSTNITIISLNTSLIYHRNWDKGSIQYYCQMVGTQPLYLYASDDATHITNEIQLQNIVCLGNTQENFEGYTYNAYKTLFANDSPTPEKWQQHQHWGNPFYKTYLDPQQDHHIILASTAKVSDIANKLKTQPNAQIKDLNIAFNQVSLTKTLRYNPYKDDGVNNQCYFLNCKQPQGLSWDSPNNPDLTNENLPLWILLYGFPDFQKKIGKQQHIDTDYTLVIKTQKTNPLCLYTVPLNISFTKGNSPYENAPNEIDHDKWYPSYQMQQMAYTDICLSGPGTPKIPQGETTEAKLHYTFHFKWGGELPDMALIANPTEKPSYPVPNNILSTTSLQNPTQAPETYLYKFDERRGILTKKAAKRMQKDWETQKTSLLSTEPRFAETPETQDPQEESTSEEDQEEDLFQQLQHQRLKQHRLKQRIKLILQQIQTIE